jgi:hypothetical protein
MKKFLFLLIPVFSLLLSPVYPVAAQSNEHKFEAGVQFTTLGWSTERFHKDRVKGGGGRFAYNFSSHFALDGEVNFLVPNHTERIRSDHQIQGLFGLKSGIRNDRFGLFGKVRPGFAYLGSSSYEGSRLKTALDVGGIGEYYPSKRTIVRLDVGDTMINRFNRHSLQMSIGFGFRF